MKLYFCPCCFDNQTSPGACYWCRLNFRRLCTPSAACPAASGHASSAAVYDWHGGMARIQSTSYISNSNSDT